MKDRLKLCLLLLLTTLQLAAQDCSGFQFTWSVNESRCMATGSIVVNATGGSGSYNYKVTGPVSSPFTSSATITGLSAGYYSVIVKDINTSCTKQVDSVFVHGTYSDPRFQLTKTDVSCANNDGTISVGNVTNGRSPFTYTIVAPSPSAVGTTSTTGNFTGLSAGEYYIRLTDSCGGLQERRITISQYIWWFNGVTVSKLGCDSATADVILVDNQGNANQSGSAFNGFMYGATVTPGDTTWFSSGHFHFYLGSNRSATIVAKDNCGNIHTYVWSIPSQSRPAASYGISSVDCGHFSLAVTGSNLTNPNFCLTDNNGNNISCNTTGNFNNIAYGSYCIRVTDACYDTTIVQCFNAAPPTPSAAAVVQISNRSCTNFTASVTGQVNLTTPSFCIYDSLGNKLSCNSTGIFDSVPYGSYCIKIQDGCVDTTISRCFTATRIIPAITSYNIGSKSCSGFSVSVSGTGLTGALYCLYDNSGNNISCDSTGAFNGIPYGNYCVRAVTACGDTTASVCFGAGQPVPSIANPIVTLRACTGFNVMINGQVNLTQPLYCLYDASNNMIACDSTGSFNNVPYGSYCMKIKDGCVDTTITRCFTVTRPYPSVNASIQQSNATCTTFTATVTGNNLTSPQYCVYDSTNTLISCNTNGVFAGLTYGSYCFTVHDNCIDTIFRVCKTFVPVHGITVSSTKTCTIGSSSVSISFASGNKPYSVQIYHPDGHQVVDTTFNTNPLTIILSAIPTGTSYRIIGSDACGSIDSTTISPVATLVTRSTTVLPKCPTGTFVNGSGDIVASYTTNYSPLLPSIVSKNGSPFVQSFSSNSGTSYTFSDLEPAQYVVQYNMQWCNVNLYDTVTVSPYTYPTQGQSALYQCDNNGFTLSANVSGGVGPYVYEIIGSQPSSPSIATTQQNNALFTINNGTAYSLVRLRSTDACGNATLSDVSVLPLQNFSVTATNTCFYTNITLSVDNIANANYTWYRKTTPTDSTQVGNGPDYNLPFFMPNDVGQYLCKINVNSGCIIREATFNLDGMCYQGVLNTRWQLEGNATPAGNLLTWKVLNDLDVSEYIVEKSIGGELFTALRVLESKQMAAASVYTYLDKQPGSGAALYRIRTLYKTGKVVYSNVVTIQNGSHRYRIYPNPVKSEVNISISGEGARDYQVQLFYANGQKVYEASLQNVTQTVVQYNRPLHLPAGVYLIRVTDKETGTTENFKVVFE